METKQYIWLGIFVGGAVGGFIGTFLDHGNGLGGWTLTLSTLGSFAGIWAGYKLGDS